MEALDQNHKDANLNNAVGALILGILSILTCICYGFIGLILAIVGLVISKGDNQKVQNNPDVLYANAGVLKAGRILCIIGLIFNILMLLYFIIVIVFVGMDELGAFDDIMRNMN